MTRTLDNIADYTNNLLFIFPQCFKNTIHITRNSIRVIYAGIWIDALCHVQDGAEERILSTSSKYGFFK